MDDVLVHNASENDHLEHLKLIFQKIREAGLKLNLSKCAFVKRYLQYQGHPISGEGIYSLKEKLATIHDLGSPQRLTKTRHLVGLASDYRIFVANFSNIVKIFTEVAKKSTFSWNPHCQQSLHSIKDTLTNSPILIFSDPNEPYVLFQMVLYTVCSEYLLMNT